MLSFALRRRFIAAALIYSCLSLPALAEQCSTGSPSRCENAEFFLQSGGEKELRSFLKGAPGVSGRSSAGDDLVRVLEGPPQDRVDLPGGDFLFSACQIHNCDDKGAVITAGNGAILAAGIIHYAKYPTPLLTVFIRDETQRTKVEEPMKQWAQAQLAEANQLAGQPKQVIETVEFRIVR